MDIRFVELLRLAELNAAMTAGAEATSREQPWAVNTVLTVYAALESLASETMHERYPSVYCHRHGFRTLPLAEKYRQLLGILGRSRDPVPPVVEYVARMRRAITLHEPDNAQLDRVTHVLKAEQMADIVTELRALAVWVWGNGGLLASASDFYSPNPYLVEGMRRDRSRSACRAAAHNVVVALLASPVASA